MATDVSRLQSYVREIRNLDEAAGHTVPELEALAQAMETLIRVEQAPSGFPFVKDLQNATDLLAVVKQLRGEAGYLAQEMRGALTQGWAPPGPAQFGRIRYQAQRTGVAFGEEVTGGETVPGPTGLEFGDRAISATVTGELQNYLDLLRQEDKLTGALHRGLAILDEKYKDLDVSLGKVTAELDATNRAWRVQAEVVKDTAEGTRLIRTEQTRFPAQYTPGQEFKALPPSVGLEDIGKQLGTERFEAFQQRVERLGFVMERDLKNVSIEAGSELMRVSLSTETAGRAVKSASFAFDKFGRSLGDTSTRFKSFDQMIARNTVKVLQWAISVGLVFGAWSQAQEMFREMITVQEAMAELSIVTGESTEAMAVYFIEIANVARETGSDINETMEATATAMRAAGGEQGVDRTVVAFDLLRDAAMYSKLSGLDMAKAIDILVSSLRQMNLPLTESEDLLNKWVAVSNAAHTSMLDLGQAFATTAAAAENAGIDIDELNGLIATMAEITPLSAQESANALRALFSAVQMPAAQKALMDYGIAIKGADGRVRDLSVVLKEINILLTDFGDGAVLSGDAVNALGYALGGQGARRAAQMTALLKNLNRAMEVTEVSAGATGEAEDALAIRMETLQTAITKLKNAFVELGEALGTEGGALGLLTSAAKSITKLVTGVKSLTEILGPATIAVTAFFAAWAVGKQFALPERMGAMTAAMSGAQRSAALAAGGLGAKPPGAIPTALGRMGGMFRGGDAGASMLYGAAAGAMTGAATGDWTQAAGTGIGTAIGFYLGGPAGGMIGAVIGTAAGDAMAEAAPYIKQQLGLEEVPTAAGMSREEILKELQVTAFGPGGIGGIFEFLARRVTSLGPREGRAAAELPEEEFLLQWIEEKLEFAAGRGMEGEQYERYQELINALEELTRVEEERTELDRIQEELGAAVGPPEVQQRYRQYQQRYLPQLEERFGERELELPLEFAEGEIESQRAYASELERMKTLTNSMLPIFDAMVLSMNSQGEAVSDLQGLFTDMGTTMATWSDEAVDFLLDEALAIVALNNEIETLSESLSTGLVTGWEQVEAAAERANLEQELATRVGRFRPEYLGLERAAAKTELEPIPGFADYTESTKREFDDLISRARELQMQFAEQLGIPPEAFDSIERWAALVGDNFEWVEGVLQQFVQQAKQEFEELGKTQEEAFNVRRLKDVDPSKMGEIAAANRYWVEYLSRLKGMSAQQYLQAEGQQFNLILGEGNVLQQIYSTNEAMLFSLQDIQEIEEKQLEGMWNIPTGATFWVPITSLFYQKGEGGGFPELPELLPPTERTADNTAETSESTRVTALGVQQLNDKMLKMFTMEEKMFAGLPEEGWMAEKPHPTYDAAMEEIRTLLAEPPVPMELDISKAIKEITDATLMSKRELIDEPDPADILGDKISNLIDFLQTTLPLLPKAGAGLGLAVPAAVPEIPPIDVNVDIPEIKGDFAITNQVVLDGRTITMYISRIIAKTLAQAITAHASTLWGGR